MLEKVPISTDPEQMADLLSEGEQQPSVTRSGGSDLLYVIFIFKKFYYKSEGASPVFCYTTIRQVAQAVRDLPDDPLVRAYVRAYILREPVKSQLREILKVCDANSGRFGRFVELEGESQGLDQGLCGSSSQCKFAFNNTYRTAHMRAYDDAVIEAMTKWEE